MDSTTTSNDLLRRDLSRFLYAATLLMTCTSFALMALVAALLSRHPTVCDRDACRCEIHAPQRIDPNDEPLIFFLPLQTANTNGVEPDRRPKLRSASGC